MDIYHIISFVNVSEHLNFSVAADYMHISQPALSRRIKDLEDELGLKLFERDQHTVMLTTHGKELLPFAKKILADCEAMKIYAKRMKAGKVGKLDIAYISNLRSWVSPLIEPFRVHYPDVHITLTKMGYSSILSGLEEGTIDFAVCFSRFSNEPSKSAISNITEREIGATIHTLVAPTSMDIRTDEDGKIPFDTLNGMPLVLLNHMSAPLVQQRVNTLADKHGFVPNIIMEADTPDDVYALVESGFGATIATENSNIRGSDKMVQYQFSDENPSLPVKTMWSKNSENTSLSLFIRHLEKNGAFTD